MRLVIQRVTATKVSVDGKTVGEIGKGLFVLLGVGQGDTEAQADRLAAKLVKLRIMADENKKMNLSVLDAKAEIIVVSQFTLYADTKKGNRPSFIKAADPDEASKLYEYFVRKLKELGAKVSTGSFGDYMDIEANLDGPVTIILEE